VCLGATAFLKPGERRPRVGDPVAVYTSKDDDKTSWFELGNVASVDDDTFRASFDGEVWEVDVEISNYGPGGWEFTQGVKPRGQVEAVLPGLLGDLPYNPASAATIPAAVLVATAALIGFLGVVRVPYFSHQYFHTNAIHTIRSTTSCTSR
jgi:hypothetical protein